MYWARLVLRDSSVQGDRWVLETGVPCIHKVDCFWVADTGIVMQRSGFLRRGPQRALQFLYPCFTLPSVPNGELTVYLRYESETPLMLPLTLYRESAYAKHDRAVQTVLAVYFGALFIMALYHLIVFAFLRDASFVYYALFIVLFAAGQMTSVYGFLVGQDSSRFARTAFPYLHIINFGACAVALLFARALLDTRRLAPRTNLALVAVAAICAGIGAASPALGFIASEQILVIMNLAVSAVMTAAAVLVLRRKYSPGLYFLWGVGVLVFGIVLYNLMYGFNLFPFSFVVYFIPNICFVFTILLFSVGIAQRILTIQLERNSAYSEAVHNLEQILQYKEEKAKLEEELSHARTMEAIGHLVSGVCHDLKNLLTPLFGYADLIRMKAADNPQIKQHADGLYAAADKTRELVMKLLDFSRKKPKMSVPVKMDGIVSDVTSLLRHGTRHGIAVTTATHVADAWVLGDPSSFQNALLNLGLNAVDAMPAGGTVSFEVRGETLGGENDLLRKFSAPAGDYVVVSVSDTGTGIPPEIMGRIFEPFFTTKGAGKGTGLGLASVYGCVKSHCGCVTVASEIGKGSTFALYFQKAKPGPGDTGAAAVSRTKAAGGTVLLINDDEMMKDMITEALVDIGYFVVHVRGIDKGNEYYRRNVDAVDLVVIDAKAENGNALCSFEGLKKINPGIRAVLITDASDRRECDQLLDRGVSAIVKKPFELDAFVKAVAQPAAGDAPKERPADA